MKRRDGIRELGDSEFGDINKVRRGVDYKRRVKRLERVLIAMLLATFVVFAVIAALAIINAGFGTFVGIIASMKISYFLLALAVIFVAYAMRFPKWELYLTRLGVRVPRRKNFLIYLSMYSMDITPGRWGRAIVGYTLNKLARVRFSHTFPAVVADIFTDYAGLALLLIIVVAFTGIYAPLSVVITLLLMIPFIFMYFRGPFNAARKRLGNVKALKSFFDVGDLYFKNNRRLGKSSYAYSILITLPSMFLTSLSLYFIILAFGINIGISYIPLVVFVYTSSLVLGYITGIPASLGVTDAVLLGYLTTLFTGVGITFAIASAITIFSRLANIWFVEGFGFGSLAYTFRYWND